MRHRALRGLVGRRSSCGGDRGGGRGVEGLEQRWHGYLARHMHADRLGMPLAQRYELGIGGVSEVVLRSVARSGGGVTPQLNQL